ncbi:leucine-rich repeat domain-containing protein [Krasilnikovia sp. MM14-A1259]|uniref:leucine-rich repeat domain-containing protein n=1 Tax=Krasilnikovia sp. MM14-A1259 TaxID=3373539 RepID=UPI00382E385A
MRATYYWEYYNEWWEAPLVSSEFLAADTGEAEPLAVAPETPPHWPPSTGFDPAPRHTECSVAGVRYVADGDQILAYDSDGRRLWSYKPDLLVPPPAEHKPGGRRTTGELVWLAAAPDGLYVLTGHGTVARLSTRPPTAMSMPMIMHRAFWGLLDDDPAAAGPLLDACDEGSRVTVAAQALKAEHQSRASVEAYYGGPEDGEARQRWYARTGLDKCTRVRLDVPARPQLLAHLPALRQLSLREVHDGRWSDLVTALPDLQELDLSNSVLVDTAPLRGIRVDTLNLSGTGVADLRGLTQAPRLRHLDLRGCVRLGQVDDLATVPTLERVNLRSCAALTSVAGLAGLPRLRVLTLQGCRALDDLTPLASLPALEELWIDRPSPGAGDILLFGREQIRRFLHHQPS